jgi:hypothetical protein
MRDAVVMALVCVAAVGGSSLAQETKEAAEKGLAVRAIARGTDPEPELGAGAVKGLAADGLTVSGKPQRVTAADAAGASRVVALGCDLKKAAPGVKAEQWDDVPPISQDYVASRKAIVEHVRKLLAELEAVR